MDLQNLKEHHEELLSFMKDSGYSSTYIRRFKDEINRILAEADSCGWQSYQEVYLEYLALIHDAQEIAILNGKEVLNLELLNEAYEQRLSLLHGYIQPSIPQAKQTSKTKKRTSVADLKIADNEVNDDRISIADLVTKAKDKNTSKWLLNTGYPA